jgi:diaminohydroxyphosphoribosylaminopyrimidine deaminase/5-amino-6-(5-phosphoribosylamino)uracil reductase
MNNPIELPDPIRAAFAQALEEAKRFYGATAPNPPVGAAALDVNGKIIAVAAHQKAGREHAEAMLLRLLEMQGRADQAHTLVVTLEPCNHFGKTPPCTQAILRFPSIRTVWIGQLDPNPKVAGGGARALRSQGLSVLSPSPSDPIFSSCAELLRPFSHWCTQGAPYITLKTAHRLSNAQARSQAFEGRFQLLNDLAFLKATLLPQPGQKTFTSQESLTQVHALRRSSDAILTGVGTVLADAPLFTVRLVQDIPEKKRTLLVMDRNQRTPQAWIDRAEALGFQVQLIKNAADLDLAFLELGKKGAHELLVEAGPLVSHFVRTQKIAQKHITIWNCPDEPDIFQQDLL